MTERYYLPEGNMSNPPRFSWSDIIYMRFLKGEEVVRVARFIPEREIVLALYPTDNPEEFSGEAFHDINDNSPRRVIKKTDLKDKIWVDLISGVPPLEILAGYKPEMVGELPGDSYKYSDNINSRRFHIVDMDEPEPIATA